MSAKSRAGASFLRRDGTVWTTDKDGLIMGLLAAEMTAVTGKDPGLLYDELTAKYGNPIYQRIDAEATPEQKAKLAKLSRHAGHREDAGGRADYGDPDGSARQPRSHRRAEGDDGEWLVRRAAVGTEDVYKIYAESFNGQAHSEPDTERSESAGGGCESLSLTWPRDP